MPPLAIVTGAFSFSGRHITARLLADGWRVRTLTGHPGRRDPFAGAVEVAPLDFADPAGLATAMRGADVLVNTYWIRFPHAGMTFARAEENSRRLFSAARTAGVRRVVHTSITNPAEDSPYPYFSGKARVERALRESGLSYAILRPAVLFGDGGILLNTIAWMLRRLPVFAVPMGTPAPLRAVLVDDFADLVTTQACATADVTLDAVGPESYSFHDLLLLIRRAVGSHALLLPAPAVGLYLGGLAFSMLLRDVVLTWDEIGGLRAGLLDVPGPAPCPTRLSDWVIANADWLGHHYMNEVALHYRQ
jgi:uncharacterized protein YbjT (DUF2867 family)